MARDHTPATIRRGRLQDVDAIERLYRTVGATPGGIARTPDEVTTAYVQGFVEESLARGILLVAEIEGVTGLAGELHTYSSTLRVFKHVLGDLTVAVHPAAQGRGIGRKLFERLIATVLHEQPDITRIELVTQETNQRALRLYEGIGFVREGRMPGRIRGPDGRLDADIPLAWLRPDTPAFPG